MEAIQRTVLGQCIGSHKSGDYHNLALKAESGDYLILSIPPAWRGVTPNVGDFGVFSYSEAIAYTTSYKLDKDNQEFHRYTALYFKAFLPTLQPEEIHVSSGSFTTF